MTPYFSFNLSVLTITLLAAAFALALVYALWQWRRSLTLARFVGHTEPERDYLEQLPPISVIVDACGETDQLPRFLPIVLEQDYDAPFEVIVIVNSAAEATSDLLSEMKAAHPNLHFTFAPYNTRTLSRKKLAIMIGIKAAQYDIVLTTNANCRPVGNQWLRTVARNFVDGTDVVLAYSHYDYAADRRLGSRLRAFDTVATGTQWITSAIHRRPYRGTSDNLAYRKALFFDNHGFAASMHLIWGEDDVFVSQIVSPDNTRVEIDPQSMLSVTYDNLPRTHRLLKMRRDFTSRYVRRAPFIAQGVMSCLWWAAHIALAAAVALNPLNLAVAAAALLILAVAWILASCSFAKAARVLQAPTLRVTAPMLALYRPIVNFRYRLQELRQKKSNYTSYL